MFSSSILEYYLAIDKIEFLLSSRYKQWIKLEANFYKLFTQRDNYTDTNFLQHFLK